MALFEHTWGGYYTVPITYRAAATPWEEALDESESKLEEESEVSEPSLPPKYFKKVVPIPAGAYYSDVAPPPTSEKYKIFPKISEKKALKLARLHRKPEVEVGNDHEHEWKTKWQGTFRICACGLKQWRLACWTDQRWEHWTPHHLRQVRRDVSEKLDRGINYVMGEVPHLIRSWDLMAHIDTKTPIHLVGAGGIGSWAAMALMKVGFTHFTVYDADVVSIENVGTQVYGAVDVRGNKTSRLLDKLSMTAGKDALANINAYRERFRFQECHGIVISTVDSMKSRKDIWLRAKRQENKVDWVIDARMGAEQAVIYIVCPKNSEDVTAYEKTLHDDKEGVEEPCTSKATAYTGMMIAGFLAKAVKDVLAGGTYPRITQWSIKDNQQMVYSAKAKDKKHDATKYTDDLPENNSANPDDPSHSLAGIYDSRHRLSPTQNKYWPDIRNAYHDQSQRFQYNAQNSKVFVNYEAKDKPINTEITCLCPQTGRIAVFPMQFNGGAAITYRDPVKESSAARSKTPA